MRLLCGTGAADAALSSVSAVWPLLGVGSMCGVGCELGARLGNNELKVGIGVFGDIHGLLLAR